MRGDGDGWTQCAVGHRHWGRYGAAGLLLRARADDGRVHVLLQHRAAWTHEGGTWGLPGGARDSDETPAAAALREAQEEAGIDPAAVSVRHVFVDDHGSWSYATVASDAATLLPTVAQQESLELRWVPEREVARLPLHGGFATTWPLLRCAPTVLVVDVANVMGSRPDGWWRDRAGAAARLLDSLERLVGRTVVLPADAGAGAGAGVAYGTVCRVVAVVEGAARAAARRDGAQAGDGLEVVAAAGSGDDEVVAQARSWAGTAAGDGGRDGDDDGRAGGGCTGGTAWVVTADRGLRARLPPGVGSVGPGWLRALTDEERLRT